MYQKATQRLVLLGLTMGSLSGTALRRNFCASSSSSSLSSRGSSNQFLFGSCMRPHPEKEYKGGEDAMFASENVLAVMDGVGGWAEHGVDPAKYSKQLAKYVQQLWQAQKGKYLSDPKALIVDSARLNKEIGSSTCVILTLDEQEPVLKASYIGDSGYVIYRLEREEPVEQFMYAEHTHGFNFPFQIGSQGDNPNTSLEHSHQVEHGDIVVVGSDGLFDNLDSKQVQSLIKAHLQKQQGTIAYEQLAKEIAETAKEKSLQQNYMSPFAQRAIDYGYYFKGGKSDDITIVVAQVQLKQDNHVEL